MAANAKHVMTKTDPDWAVFEAVQTWPERADPESVFFRGVNLGHAVRRSVILALSAVMRPIAYPELGERDTRFRETWGLDADAGASRHDLRRTLKQTVVPSTLGRLSQAATAVRARRVRAGTSAPRLLVKSTSRLDALIHSESFDFPGSVVVAGTSPREARAYPFIPVLPQGLPARSQFRKFRHALQQELGDLGYALDPASLDAIVDDARFEAARVKAIQHTLRAAEPSAILLHDDTSPEGLTWALAAQANAVPSIAVAHGLDCERFFLDPVYASMKCVWGPERAERIRATARRLHGDQADEPTVQVTGNPAYDGLEPPPEPGSGGHRWLWVTRPHTPHKCFTPGRFPIEGADILDALLDALRQVPDAHLTIKPHPADYSQIYERKAADAGLQTRVTLRHDALEALFPETDVVIAEDSTAALDACLAGKPIVHAHFAPSPAVLPLVATGAALPGFDAATCIRSLVHQTAQTPETRTHMFQQQRAFTGLETAFSDSATRSSIREIIDRMLARSQNT